ncbi:MAG TPA: D-alanyl-D-alanine carboxypeptidase/D-alanyl-D-alanine-endopeptidase [Propionibacteriaceae bacterium]|nr:D-alanyl-D-alanine carboxypeptidase/D-alanyl-D-alanine-endopeptidase [Propionibacteriaceae bacterium]
MRLNRFVLVAVVVLLVGASVLGVLTGAFASAARAGLTATGLLSDGGASTVAPTALKPRPASAGTSNTPAPTAPASAAPDELPDVMPVAAAKAPPVKSRLDRALASIDHKAMKGRYSGSVLDVGTGRAVYAHNAGKAAIPASTLKLVTAAAALSVLGPQHRFSTQVVSPRSGRIVLVGGGDPYLVDAPTPRHPGAASVARLAQLTAARLKETRQAKVSLGYDASLFTGPAWHPDWPPMYSDQVTPISALWVNEGRRYGSTGPRVSKPALVAAETFARALRRNGIRVTDIRSTKKPRQAQPVAAVASQTLDRIVEHMLMVSDNDASEVLARQAAVGAGQPGSFAAARQVVRAQLVKLGVWDERAQLRDGSGLSRRNKLPAALLTKLLRVSQSTEHPELRGVLTGLPVAGVEGSLRIRYLDRVGRPARGLLRGKTGTLTGVHGLAGYLRRPDGSVLAYAFLVNDAKDGQAARLWLEHVTATLSSCRCR